MAIKQNTRYPLLLRKDKYIKLSSSNYSLTASPSVSNNFPLTLDWDTSLYDNNIYLGYFNDTSAADNNIDLLVNSSNLENIKQYLSEQDNKDYTIDSLNFYLLYKDLNSAIKFTSILQSDIIYNNINNSMNKYKELYDIEYSKYLYRANRNNRLLVTSGELRMNDSQEFISIFSVDTNNQNLECDLYIRNIPIPFKKWMSSVQNGLYHFIFIAPNYILKNYTQYIKAIQKIKFNDTSNIYINYSYLDKANTKLNEANISLNKSANTFSNKSL